jgi:uncharacterized protein YuzE
MKLNYFPDTDTLYISLAERDSVGTEVYSESLQVDVDQDGVPVGITIEHYSQAVTSQDIEINLPQDAPFSTVLQS